MDSKSCFYRFHSCKINDQSIYIYIYGHEVGLISYLSLITPSSFIDEYLLTQLTPSAFIDEYLFTQLIS